MKRTPIAVLAALSFAAGTALAAPGDLTVVNASSTPIHPYFKSKCWNPALFPDAKPHDWVFFGGIAARSQFTWNFNELLDPACKRDGDLKFTFTTSDAPPSRRVDDEQKTEVDFNAAGEQSIRVLDKPVIENAKD